MTCRELGIKKKKKDSEFSSFILNGFRSWHMA
jgi:hypothetical protein